MKFVIGLLFYITASTAWASIVDYGPLQDQIGNWRFDLYDFNNLERGTATNPLYFSTSGGAPSTSALQTSGNNYLSQIAANTASALTDTTISGNITAANGTVTVMSQGAYTITASITGTFVATLIAEAQLADNTWIQVPMYNAPLATANAFVSSVTGASSITIIGGGYLNVRIRATSYTSGTAVVALDASIAQQSTLAAQLGVWNTGRTWTLNSTSDVVSVAPIDGVKATYSAAVTSGVPVTVTPTDVLTITGSATKTIRILRIGVSGSQTTAGQRDIVLIKRSTADSGGTSTAVIAVPNDSNNAAATATVLFYTANPTLGTSAGAVRSAKLFFATTATDSDNFSWEFGTRPGQAIVLRGTSQQLAINLNSLAGVGNSVNLNVEWSEE